MADSKVSALTALAVTPDDADEFYINDGGVSKKITYVTLKTALKHDAVTVVDSTSIDFTLTGQQITAAAIFGTTAGTVCQGNDARLQSLSTLHAIALSF